MKARTESAMPQLDVTPDLRRIVGHAAQRIARKYGTRVDADDLFQVGMKRMVIAAKAFKPGAGKASSVWGFAKRTAITEMDRYAANEVRTDLFLNYRHEGDTDEWTYHRLCLEWMDRLKGWQWVSVIHRGSRRDRGEGGGIPVGVHRTDKTLNISVHALERFRERVNATGTREDIRRRVLEASPAPAKLSLILTNRATAVPGDEAVVGRGVAYILRKRVRRTMKDVVTVLTPVMFGRDLARWGLTEREMRAMFF